MHLKMSSAICFNLDQSEILSSGNGLIFLALIPTDKGIKFKTGSISTIQIHVCSVVSVSDVWTGGCKLKSQ